MKDPLQAARRRVGAQYFIYGVASASWVVLIPTVRDGLALDSWSLGVALLCKPIGALLAMQVAGVVIHRDVRPRTMRAAALALCCALVFPAYARGGLSLCVALALLGLASGAMNVAINVEGAAVERAHQRPIMTSLHGLFSFGGLVGAAVGGVAVSHGFTPLVYLTTTAVILAICAWLATAGTDRGRPLPTEPDGASCVAVPRANHDVRTVAGVAMIAFCVLFGEGAMANWSAVYLRDIAHASSGMAAAGYGAFSLAMTGGRFSGDRLIVALGRIWVVRLAGTTATLGLALALLVPQLWAALVGFACIGVGSSVVFPIALSAAGRSHNGRAGRAIATVSTVGFLGFLAGPVLIGWTADHSSLRAGLAWVLVTSVLVGLLARTVDVRPSAAE